MGPENSKRRNDSVLKLVFCYLYYEKNNGQLQYINLYITYFVAIRNIFFVKERLTP